MRLATASSILELARLLASSAEGMTIEEIASRFDASRRTAERMRDAVEATFGTLDRLEDGKKIRFRLSACGIGRFAVAPTAEEVAELLNVARSLKIHDPIRARTFESLATKIAAALRDADRRRLAPDVETRLRTEVWAHGVGPKEACRAEVLAAVREALIADRVLDCAYRRVGSDEPASLRLVPYGLIFGTYHYLVAGFEESGDPHLLRLDRLDRVTVTETIARAPAGFDVRTYARRSVGLFQEEPRPIELLFRPEAASEAGEILFHPDQTAERLGDGCLRVRFTAGGIGELKRHLARWGDRVRLIEPSDG